MDDRRGPLTGLRVVELASDHAALAGKLLGDMGAEVVVVEPPGGHRSRAYGPFLDDEPGLERSLWWWHYNTSKLSVVLDLNDATDGDRFRRLVSESDIVLEGEPPGRLADLQLDADHLSNVYPRLIWVSVTAFGRENPRRDEEFTDLTVLASGGPMWTCGYDDHTLPPIRGGGNQGYQIGAVWAAIGALTAVLAREVRGVGQLVDVSLHAAANVTTESGTFQWFAANREIERLTCRHAVPEGTTSQPTLALCADGSWLNTGILPRTPREFKVLVTWLEELGLRDGFADAILLDLGAARESIDMADIGVDPELTEILRAGREGMFFIASNLSAQEFFVNGQQRGLTCGPIFAPEEIMANEHIVDRAFPVTLSHEEFNRTVVYPGAPFIMSASPLRLARAPRLGEHQTLVDALTSE